MAISYAQLSYPLNGLVNIMSRQLEISYSSLQELPVVTQKILDFTAPYKIFAIEGDMGSGKTTLIKELCRHLGVTSVLSSPTYSIVNEYMTTSAQKVFHMDLYRLHTADEAVAIGVEEYLHAGSYCFIEWPSIIAHILPREVVKIDIRVADGFRNLSIFTQ